MSDRETTQTGDEAALWEDDVFSADGAEGRFRLSPRGCWFYCDDDQIVQDWRPATPMEEAIATAHLARLLAAEREKVQALTGELAAAKAAHRVDHDSLKLALDACHEGHAVLVAQREVAWSRTQEAERERDAATKRAEAVETAACALVRAATPTYLDEHGQRAVFLAEPDLDALRAALGGEAAG